MENYKNVFAFDIGIGSTGASVSDDLHMVYMGTHVFNVATEAKTPRLFRSARRTLSRKKWRKKQLRDAFDDFDVISKETINQSGYLCFTTNTEDIKRPIDKTVYHLRKRALNEQVSKREILLCIYNILHARGHFLMETIDFVNSNRISYKDFEEKFYVTIEGYINIPQGSREKLNENILKPIFLNGLNKNEIRKKCDEADFLIDDLNKDKLIQFLLLICNYSANPNKIDESFEIEKCTISSLKTVDGDLPEILTNAVELNDLMNVSRIMSSHDYLCELAVEKIDEFDAIDKNSNEYKEYEKNLKGKQTSSAKHLRVVRNLENGFPNGLYVKETRDILRKQQNYYSEITDDFIEVCESIVSARIPYFMGPQKEDAKNAWVKKNGNFKYSYDYSMKHGAKPVDEYASIKAWKERMISRCTYLPDEYALPKGSFVAETFSILNELNILSAVDENEDDYYLTCNDKIRIIDQLFMTGKEVKYSDVASLLGLKSFGTKKQSDLNRKFNNKYTLYPIISNKIPNLKMNSITNIFSEPNKIDELENIILSINLYNEEKSKYDYFKNESGFSDDVAKSLSKLKSNSFYSYSKKFVLNQPMDQYGNTLMSLLFEDNTNKFKNEQMTLITKAVDENGNPLDFSANKYEKILEENGGKLSVDLLIQGDTPLIPISRPVIRGLNEAMKMYVEMVKVFGVPKRIIIETARDLKDHSVIGEQPAKHFEKVKGLYDYLETQVKENKKYSLNVEKWDDIEKYEVKDKLKIELYIRQNGLDLLTGEKIDITHLENYEVDHILPRGFGDDSLDDKMLISKLANGKKGNRLPLEFIESGEQVGNKVIVESEYIKNVESLYDMKLISEQKRQKLLLQSSKDLQEFINQNLVDTRYIIREFMAILNAYNKYHKYDCHVVSLRAAYTSLYRKAFDFDKVRDYGDQHHAHDAALLIVADKTLSTYYPNYDQRNPKDIPTKGKSYTDFIQDMLSSDNEKTKSLKYFIKEMFRKAYGISSDNPLSIIAEIKNTVPFYSTKVEKNYKGKFFDATILNHQKYKETDVLSLVDVNNDKHVFSSVNCVAVDFYKVTDKKGKKKHIAIHIPKVIVDNNGKINEEKYLKLIKQHYGAEELLDSNGKLITGYFRFRAYKNDIIYNTVANCPMLFNIGSIVNKKLELMYINVFSYNNIYVLGNHIRFNLINEFNLKTKSNPEGVQFNDISKNVYVEYVNRNYWKLPADDKRILTVINLVKNDKNIYDLANHLSYIGFIIDRPGTPPTIVGQYKPVINNEIIKTDEDAEYIKLKYNILGLRFIQNPNGKLIVVSPKEIRGSFKQIKKEEFTWNIKNDELK